MTCELRAATSKNVPPACAVVRSSLHPRPPPAVDERTTAHHTLPAHARRGPGITRHPPRASSSRRARVTVAAGRLSYNVVLPAATTAPRARRELDALPAQQRRRFRPPSGSSARQAVTNLACWHGHRHTWPLSTAPLNALAKSPAVVILLRVPNIGKIGPYRFFFYSNERDEPAHIHIRRDRALAKFWLGDVSLASSKGFAAHELRELERLVTKHRNEFRESWDEHFGS